MLKLLNENNCIRQLFYMSLPRVSGVVECALYVERKYVTGLSSL